MQRALQTVTELDDAAAAEACREALDLLHAGQGDPQAVIARVLSARPDFVAAHCLRAAGLVMASRDDALPALDETLRTARLHLARASERERAHLAAAQAWLDKDMKRSLRLYGEIAERDPKDTLALRVAQFGDLQWGRTDLLRERIAAALRHWHPDEPGYGHVLAMYAFGLAEAADPVSADALGREALRFEPRQCGAVHAVAHALEMQGRSADGAAWLEGTRGVWSGSTAFSTHLWWHESLFRLDQGDLGAVLRILDQRLMHRREPDTSALVDASALLWRLHLRGLDVAGRWQRIADAWEAHQCAGLRPFNDVHAMLAFVATHRWGSARRLLDALRDFALRAPDLRTAVFDAALPVCQAFVAFGQGRYAVAAQQLDAQQRLVRGCGGSRAQCDLLHLTWLEAALRSHQSALARQLLRERIASRPQSPYNESLRERIARALHNGDTAAITGCTPDTSAVQTHCHAVTPLRQSGAGPARGPMARVSARRGLVTATSKGA